jgi:hypothetical protein
MNTLRQAEKHFDEDIQRARDLLAHARTVRPSQLQHDMLRSVWMLGVGALDAFFCDAFGDLIAKTLQAKQNESDVAIPDRMLNLRIPAHLVIRRTSSDNWRWRMAARAIIEDESVLSFDDLKRRFNQFFRPNHKLFSAGRIARWIQHRHSKHRLFGILPAGFRAIPQNQRAQSCQEAIKHLERRFETIFQRRHDCIHNCDRVKMRPNRKHVSSPDYVEKVVYDIEFFATRFTEEIRDEFPHYLRGMRFGTVTLNRVGAT